MNSNLNDVKLKTVSLMFIVNRFLGLDKWQPGIGQNFNNCFIIHLLKLFIIY